MPLHGRCFNSRLVWLASTELKWLRMVATIVLALRRVGVRHLNRLNRAIILNRWSSGTKVGGGECCVSCFTALHVRFACSHASTRAPFFASISAGTTTLNLAMAFVPSRSSGRLMPRCALDIWCAHESMLMQLPPQTFHRRGRDCCFGAHGVVRALLPSPCAAARSDHSHGDLRLCR